MQPLITPNWHIAVVHFPIALIVMGTLVELFSFLGWRGSGFRRAGRWMLLLGAVLSVPTTFSGMYAFAQLVPGGIDALRQSQPELARSLTQHVWTQSIATAAAMLIVVLWIALSAGWRDRLNLLFKLALLGVSGLVLFGAHMGGDMVYNRAMGVDVHRPPATLPSTTQMAKLETWENLAPPDQTHVTFAGLAIAVACVTLGMAIHTASTHDDLDLPANHAERIAAAFAPQGPAETYPPAEVIVVSRNATGPVFAARFWLLSALLLAVTALLGDWLIAQDTGWNLNAMWDKISKPIEDGGPAFTRLLAHLIAAGILIVDSLILAILARFAPRRSVMLLVFALPMVLALAAQIWLGVLLLFNGPAGAVTGFYHG